MKKIKAVVLLGCAVVFCLALAACGGSTSAEKYVGTWDLQYSEPAATDTSASQSAESADAEGDEAADGTEDPTLTASSYLYTEEDLSTLRASDLDIFLNIEENSYAFDILDAVTTGQLSVSGGTLKFMDMDGNQELGTAKLNGETLELEMWGTNFYFQKGEDKDVYDTAEDSDVVMADDRGMSIIMAEGEPFDDDDKVTIADDDTVTIIFDGSGVDSVGDPGYNMQVTNNTDNQINIWAPNNFTVDGKDVMAYLFFTLDPGKSTTQFLQLDGEDIGSSSVDALKDVHGSLQVTNSSGEEIANYDVDM